MRKILQITLTAFFAIVLLEGCKKLSDKIVEPEGVSIDESLLIKNAGLNPGGAVKIDGKYLIEGDLLLSADELRDLSTNNGPEVIVANSEQYRTTNLVTGLPRVIKVRYAGTNTNLSTAINAAIARYNARGLLLTFSRVTSGQNINIVTVNSASYIASAGFPSGGNPYSQIIFNLQYANWNANTLTSVMAHEIGHCIGFRHTDYMNRQYSCGGSFYNEGSAGVGAIHIPGTPTGPDANSWMLACIGNGVNRPFNTNDRTALNYLY